MNLLTPLIQQKEGSSDCGIACVAMILEYYGIKKSIKELKKDIPLFKGVGTYMPQLGLHLLSQNFDAEIITMNPHLFNASFKNAKKKKLLTHLKKRYEVIHKKEMKKCVEFFIKFIEAGEKLTVDIPNTKDIQEEIKNKRPLVTQLTSDFLSTKYLGFNFHFNIIAGIDKKKSTQMTLPKEKSRTKPLNTCIQYHSAAFGEADNASIMKIRYKK